MSAFAALVFTLLGDFACQDVAYDPFIDSIIKAVSADSISWTISSLTGEVPVTIEGVQDSLPLRHAYSPDCYKAARWLREQMEKKGLEAELEPVLVDRFADVDILPSGYGWLSAGGWDPVFAEGVHLYRTEDAGASWEGMRNDTSSWNKLITLSSDSMVGIAGTRIVRTTDGGQSFQTVLDLGALLSDISMLNRNEYWAAGGSFGDAILFSTGDGWKTYKADTFPDRGNITHVDFVSPDTGWYVTTFMHLWRTTNGGDTWTAQNQPIKEISALQFTESKTGYIIGKDTVNMGRIIKTTDAGVVWQTLLDSLGPIPRGMSISGKDTLWVVGDSGLFLVSYDASQNWTRKEVPTKKDLTVIGVNPDGKGFIAGNQEMLTSADLENWERPQVADGNLMWNVVGKLAGQDSTQVLITAHYDARSESQTWTPGADDNASGIAAVMEAARLFAGKQWKHSLRFICFGGEEVGMFGSRGYANRAFGMHDDILAVLNADMIGYDGNEDRLVEVDADPAGPKSIAAAKMLVGVNETYAIGLDPRIHTIDSRRNSDHSSFWLTGVPALFLGENRDDFNPFYHSTGDRLKQLDTFYLTQNTRASVGWMAFMVGLDSIVGTKEIPYMPPEMISVKPFSTIVKSRCSFTITSPCPLQPRAYDAAGRLVRTFPIIGTTNDRNEGVTLDLTGIPAGVYWVIFYGSRGHASARIVLID